MATVSVSSELFQQASSVAAAQGRTVEEFAEEALRNAVADMSVRQELRNGIPVMMVGKGVPPIEPSLIRQSIEEEGF